MTRADFDTALARFRTVPGGTVTQHDYFPGTDDQRPAYRGAWLTKEVNAVSLALTVDNLARLALATRCYLTMSVAEISTDEHDGRAEISLQATRDLEPDEIGEAPASGRREVP